MSVRIVPHLVNVVPELTQVEYLVIHARTSKRVFGITGLYRTQFSVGHHQALQQAWHELCGVGKVGWVKEHCPRCCEFLAF